MLDGKLASAEETAAEVLAWYCLEQLSLHCEMCLDRSLNCIEAVRGEFSFDLLLHGLLDKRLPATCRAAFAQLAQPLYFDCPPQTRRQLPTRVHVLEDLRTGATPTGKLPNGSAADVSDTDGRMAGDDASSARKKGETPPASRAMVGVVHRLTLAPPPPPSAPRPVHLGPG